MNDITIPTLPETEDINILNAILYKYGTRTIQDSGTIVYGLSIYPIRNIKVKNPSETNGPHTLYGDIFHIYTFDITPVVNEYNRIMYGNYFSKKFQYRAYVKNEDNLRYTISGKYAGIMDKKRLIEKLIALYPV